ncbi:hypothetical protein VDS41_07075 [Xanthomonas campestris pv. campestris]|nr:hypothetical protein [Xanthomonas campestris pv. campestris]
MQDVTHKKTRIGRCGFSGNWACVLVLCLVADPHRPRTIIRAQIAAVIGVGDVGQKR